MSSSTPSPNMTSSTEPPRKSDSGRNAVPLVCGLCSSVIILAEVAEWTEKHVEMPLPRQQKGAPATEMETVSGFWSVPGMFDFENVGFTHSVAGVKYLTCADCEFGPIGVVDEETKLHLITPQRLKYKE